MLEYNKGELDSSEEEIIEEEVSEEEIVSDNEADDKEGKEEDPTDNEGESDTEVSSDEDIENSEESKKESEEIEITIEGEEQDPEDEIQSAPKWVKDVRKANRQLKKEKKELEEKLKSITQAETKPAELGPKPTLEGSDYDSEVYESKLDEWYKRKAEVDEAQAKKEQEKKSQDEAWNKTLNQYNEDKLKLNVVDYESAEDNAFELLTPAQQGMIIHGSDNPSKVIYALGTSPKKLKELSQMDDMVKFAFKISKLETQLKETVRKRPATKPEKTVKSGAISGNVNVRLEQLRKRAEETGDYTEVMKYRRQLKSKK